MLLTDWDWNVAKKVWQEEAKEEGRQSGLLEGELKGLLQAYKEMGLGLDAAIERIAKKFDLTSEDASQKAALYW